MKKVILSLLMITGLTFTIEAQDFSKNAIGFRLGSNDGFGAEVSYQKKLSDVNRLEIDLGWRNSNEIDAFKLAGVYQWVWNIEGDFNWYAGFGGGLGSWSHSNNTSGSFIFAAGDVGIEYNFDIPLQLSLDVRPEIGFGDYKYTNSNANTFSPDIALGIRYRF
ncbi:hypothetical protein [Flavobacterium sp.]|uniref:hypothetical protein n=1 Tax=Flavobacterium sp. TaxID=239 RepID=UPI0038FC4EF4